MIFVNSFLFDILYNMNTILLEWEDIDERRRHTDKIGKALKNYYLDYSKYPDSLEILVQGWYISEIPKDPKHWQRFHWELCDYKYEIESNPGFTFIYAWVRGIVTPDVSYRISTCSPTEGRAKIDNGKYPNRYEVGEFRMSYDLD